MADLNIDKQPGIGDDDAQGSSRPLNEATPLAGPALWSASGNDRQSSFKLTGAYVHSDPTPVDTGPYPHSRLLPTSDLTGTAPLPTAETVGRTGPKQIGGSVSTVKPLGNPPAVNNQ